MTKEEILIGKTYEEAQEILRNANYRLVMRDGINYMITTDFKPERYNIHLENNIVTKVNMG